MSYKIGKKYMINQLKIKEKNNIMVFQGKD